MEYLIIGVAACILVAILGGYIKLTAARKSERVKKSKAKQPVKCPICETNLFVGENLISKVYRPMNVPDQLMIIMGCPHCYPKCEQGVKRICPVCHKPMEWDQSLTARLFNKAVGKKHVHVVGCSNCHKPRAD